MNYNISYVLVLAIVLQFCRANETNCSMSQKLFAKLCFNPSPNLDIDFDYLRENEPEGGWYVELGNDVEQLHISELLKGELLSPKDNFTDMCYRFKIGIEGETSGTGIVLGYGNLTSNWTCSHSKDFRGAESCDLKSTLSKYHEDMLAYYSFMDSETKVALSISCYPTGQVGWVSMSKDAKMSDKEKEVILAHAEKLGFPKDTNAILYHDNCHQ